FPGAVIASELQDLPLDAEELRPFWKTCADLNLYVFIHPLPRVIRWARMNADDLGRMLGWKFSLMTAAVRLVNSRLLDDLPSLKILFSHFAGGIGRYRCPICGFQAREPFGTAQLPRHGRRPRQPFGHYLDQRLYYDIAGWAGPDRAAEYGQHWVRFGLEELPLSQLVFASDYPQAVRDPGEVAAYVEAVRDPGEAGRGVAGGADGEKLIPDLKRRLAARVPAGKVPAWTTSRQRRRRRYSIRRGRGGKSSSRSALANWSDQSGEMATPDSASSSRRNI